MAPKWLRVATMRRPGSFAPRFPISLIPADIPGSFCEFRFLRLIRNAVGEEGLYGPPVPAQPRERRRNQHGSTVKVLPYTRAVCSSRSPHRFSISLIPNDIPGSFCEFRFLCLIRSAVGEGLYGPPVPGPTTGAPPEPTREHRKGTPYARAVCSSRSPASIFDLIDFM